VNYMSEGLFEKKIDQHIMPKITYPRPCPTCGKEFRVRSTFSCDKKECDTFKHRYQCPLCPLSFSFLCNKQWHVRQQHSKTPERFPCTFCGKVFTRRQNLKDHMETLHGEGRARFHCWYCDATFAWKKNCQKHMRVVHGRVCREQDANLKIHLQHLSESDEFQHEWVFVESRPVQPGEHIICNCGQPEITSYFFIENKINGNRTIVGSTCIRNIDPKVGAVIAYFKHIMERGVCGEYKGQDNEGLHRFQVKSNTVLVQRLFAVEHLNPQVSQTESGKWEVSVMFSTPVTLLEGDMYFLRLKAKFRQGQLTFTAM